jgi:hypothetical protein
MEAMRFRSPKDKNKLLWITSEVREENESSTAYAAWMDAGKPWLAITVDEIKFNLDTSEFIRARGY